MGESIEKVRTQLNEYFQSLNKKQKILIGLGSFFLVVTMALAIFYFTRPNYVTMYSNLSLQEAGEITAKLDELNIPWKDDVSGSKILVPKEYLNKARMNLAIEGYPNEGITWEDAINNSSITMTSEERKMKFLRAQMNELSNTIQEINGINEAQVHLTVPDKSSFLTEDYEQSKASVLLNVKPGFKLNPQQVNGIVMLVSNAVDGLIPENISVHDNTGTILNNQASANDSTTANNYELQNQVKTRLEESIKQLLNKIYGEENVDVMVDVDMNFDKEVSEIVEYSPPIDGETSGLVRSLNELKEQVVNGATGGPPGTDSNSEITEYNEIDNEDSGYTNENRTVNYELNEIRKNIVTAPGQIKNVTVAVILNRRNLIDGELTDEHRQELINLVSAAAGLQTKVVEVMARDFNDSNADMIAISNETESTLTSQLPLYSLGIVSLLLIAGVIFFSIRARRRKAEMAEILEGSSVQKEDIEEIDLDLTDKSSYKNQIEKFVDKKPEAVAQLLRTWLNED